MQTQSRTEHRTNATEPQPRLKELDDRLDQAIARFKQMREDNRFLGARGRPGSSSR